MRGWTQGYFLTGRGLSKRLKFDGNQASEILKKMTFPGLSSPFIHGHEVAKGNTGGVPFCCRRRR
jgi:hypothetical protein